MSASAHFMSRLGLGARIYVGGIIAMGLVALALGDFDPTRAVPVSFPARTLLAYSASLFMLLAGCAMAFQLTVSRGALALTIYEVVVVTLLMNSWVIIRHSEEYSAYFGAVEGLALGASALPVLPRTIPLPQIGSSA